MPKGVYIHIPHKGMFQKGQPSPNKGKHHSKETIEKIRLSNLGQKRSEETCLKIGLSKKGIVSPLKGKKLSPELIEKNRISHIGIKPTLETRVKMSICRLGDNNHNYIDGRTRLGSRHTQDLKLKIFREECFKRDNWTCKECGKYGGYLEVHHIKSWAKFPELRYDINNGQTLCKKCHKLTNNYCGKKEKINH